MSKPLAVYELGENALLICFPNRLRPGINRSVLNMAQRLRESGLPLEDVVPGYASILVTFLADPVLYDDLLASVLSVVKNWRPGTDVPSGTGADHHDVPVHYGGDAGPDLEELASTNNLSVPEAIRLHTGTSYRVYFLGFLPGFAYLASLPSALAAPRRPTPRTRVPAGSVAVAGLQTAVYPFESPGGWRILGRTALQVWDPYRTQPALFKPGDTVRYVPSEGQPQLEQPATPLGGVGKAALEVVSAGGPTAVQDLGRTGLGHLGVARGGCFDASAALRANALAGNSPDSALLEMTWQGPSLRANRNITIALSGAAIECRVEGQIVPNDLSWFVRQGSIIRFSGVRESSGGMRSYLAVAGGIDVPLVLGSRSTALQAHFGGFRGRLLEVGDLLEVGPLATDPAEMAGRYWPSISAPLPSARAILRYVPYSGRGAATASASEAFRKITFETTQDSDRMGCRLKPLEVERLPTQRGELLSFGVVRGGIQLPPSGHPIVLNVDHQTTGGYPLLGVVARVDWPLLAQLRPGAQIRFQPVSASEARELYASEAKSLRQALNLLRNQYQHPSG